MTTILQGKTALITGASRGIGRALAIGLARHGANVAVVDLTSQIAALEQTARLIEAEGRQAYTHVLDVTEPTAIADVVRAIETETGGVDILVNNAGILTPRRLEELSEAEWHQHFDVNAKGVWMMCREVLKYMRPRKQGRIVNIASLAGRQGDPTQGAYAASKSAVMSLTRVFAMEAGSDGIIVNSICPGIILTDMGYKNFGEDALGEERHWAEMTALKRLGDPDDVVGPVVFFASELSGYVTGQALNVCGGMYYH
ncbi:MAG: SDR family NAD(P)-dependent oxidoreductase [Rhodospirillaceae bacterium]